MGREGSKRKDQVDPMPMLAEKGLIPLSAADRQIVRTTGEKLELLSM